MTRDMIGIEQPGARRGGRVRWTVVTLLSLAVAGYSVGQYATADLPTLGARGVGLAQAYADRPFPGRIAFYAHIGFAGELLIRRRDLPGLRFSPSPTAHPAAP